MIKRVGATAAPMELYKIKLRTYLIISEDNNNKRKYIKYMSSEFIPIGQSAMRTGITKLVVYLPALVKIILYFKICFSKFKNNFESLLYKSLSYGK